MKRGLAEKRAGDQGFAMLFVLFLMALILIGGSTVVLDQLTQGKREREADMIWRGKQYQRAIGMYYRKFGRFPTSVDDLVKLQNGEVRFLRQAYKNPMNKKDGTWRFIYVTPAGQLIGSVQYVSLQQMAFLDQQRRMGLTTGAATGTTSDSNAPGNDADTQSGSGFGTNATNMNFPGGGAINALSLPQQAAGQNPQQPGGSSFFSQTTQGPSASPGSGNSFFSQPATGQPGTPGEIGVNESSSGASDSTDSNGQVIGGFIVGVAGKDDKPSLKVYKGGATYKRWEFIFNPLEQVATIGGLSGGATTSSPTASPNGSSQFPNQTSPLQPQTPQQPQIPQPQ